VSSMYTSSLRRPLKGWNAGMRRKNQLRLKLSYGYSTRNEPTVLLRGFITFWSTFYIYTILESIILYLYWCYTGCLSPFLVDPRLSNSSSIFTLTSPFSKRSKPWRLQHPTCRARQLDRQNGFEVRACRQSSCPRSR